MPKKYRQVCIYRNERISSQIWGQGGSSSTWFCCQSPASKDLSDLGHANTQMTQKDSIVGPEKTLELAFCNCRRLQISLENCQDEAEVSADLHWHARPHRLDPAHAHTALRMDLDWNGQWTRTMSAKEDCSSKPSKLIHDCICSRTSKNPSLHQNYT